jgi:purine nucleoside phosphorylase
MSTVPELLAAGQIGLECIVLTMITNLAAGLQKVLSHIEVHDEAMKAGPKLANLVSGIIKGIDMERETHVKLKDQINVDQHLPSYKIKNPKPVYPVKDWIADALEVLQATNLGHEKVDEAYWFMSYGAHRDIIKNADLKDIREIPFDEIPNMPTKTSSAKNSKLAFATASNGNRVLLILNSFLEGLIPVEAFFLVHLLKAKGITMIKFIIEAATTKRRDNLGEGCFVVASDYLNKSWFPSIEPNLNYFYPFKSIQRHLQKKFKNILVDKLGKEVSDFDDICFVLQDGPCFPTDSNVEMYKFALQDLYTITNTAAIDTANSLGLLQMTFVVVRNHNFSMHENPKAREIADVLFTNFSNDMIAEDIGYEGDLIKIQDHIKEFSEHNRPLDLEKVDYIEVGLPMVLEVEPVEAALKQISDFFDLEKKDYIGVHIHHFSFNQIINHFKIKKVVKFTGSEMITQNLPELVHCTLVNDESIELLVVKGMLAHQETIQASVRTIPTRLLHMLGANKFVIFGDVFGADEDEMKIGDIFFPTDHLNMSIQNPNIGKNIDEWGRRFYDVSKCYDEELMSRFIELAKEEKDMKIWKSHLFISNNAKPYAGRAEKRFCKGIGSINGAECMGVSFYGYNEMMTIRHMDFEDTFKTIYIGIIYDNCVNETDDDKYGVENIDMESYTKGLERCMNVFEKFVKEM